MKILDQFKKSKDKEAEKNHTTPPPQGHTLAEVLQDKNKSHLFGELLKKNDKENLAQKLVEGKLEKGDIELLEEQRKIFSKKITQSEKIEKLLTKDNVVEFARNHPKFEKIINLIGPEKAIRVIQSQLKDISVTDEGRFNSIASAMEIYESYRNNGEYKAVNDKVEKLCKDKNISPQEYLTALAIEDPEEKEKALKKLSRRTYGNFKKAINFVSGGILAENTTLDALKHSEGLLEISIDNLNTYQGEIGSALFASVSDNDQIRNNFLGELVHEKAPVEAKNGFVDAKKESTTFNQEDFDTDWEDFKTKIKYTGLNDSDKRLARDMFIDEQKDLYGEREKENKGFWAYIFKTIAEAIINSKKNTLK